MRESNSNSNSNSNPYNEAEIVVDADAETMDDDPLHSPSGSRRQVGGAAALGGVAGLVVGGPLVGLVAAGGAAAVATSKGKAGDVARAGGDVMSDAGVRLKRFDRKHHIVEKTSNGIVKGCQWVSKQIKQPEKQGERQSQTRV